jgi:hypothetical protein
MKSYYPFKCKQLKIIRHQFGKEGQAELYKIDHQRFFILQSNYSIHLEKDESQALINYLYPILLQSVGKPLPVKQEEHEGYVFLA